MSNSLPVNSFAASAATNNSANGSPYYTGIIGNSPTTLTARQERKQLWPERVQTYNAGISEAGTASAASVGTEHFNGPFTYPRCLFEKDIPLKVLWRYRRERQHVYLTKEGCSQPDPEEGNCNGDTIMEEIKSIRDRLKTYTLAKYKDDLVAAASKYGLKLPTSNLSPKTNEDLTTALLALENIAPHHDLIYKVFLYPFQNRYWACNVVESFSRTYNIIILSADKTVQRNHNYERGSWSFVVNQAKSQASRRFLPKLMDRKGFKIALKCGQGKGKGEAVKKKDDERIIKNELYKRIEIKLHDDEQNCNKGTTKIGIAWLVTKVFYV